jgi:hypothetical protein
LKPYLDPENQGANYNGLDPQHFDGIMKVFFTVEQETSTIILYSKYLEYESITLRDGESAIDMNWEKDEDKEMLEITLLQPIMPNKTFTIEARDHKYIVKIAFFYLYRVTFGFKTFLIKKHDSDLCL